MNVPVGNISALYQAEVRRLRAIVRRIVGSQGAAEDVVQQAFTNLLRMGAQRARSMPATSPGRPTTWPSTTCAMRAAAPRWS